MAETAGPGVPSWLQIAAAWAWRVLVVAVAVFVAGMAFSRLHVVTVPLVAALFLATLLAPPAQWLRRHHVPGLLATWIVFLVVSGAIAGIVLGILPTARVEFATLGADLVKGLSRAQGWLVNGPLGLSRSEVKGSIAKIQGYIGKDQTTLLKGALSGVAVVGELAAGLLLTLVLTFFMVKDAPSLTAWAAGLVRNDVRARQARKLGRAVWGTLTGYVRGTAVNGVVNAAVLSLTLVLLGVPLVLPVALLTFVGSFIPLAGAIISGLLAALVTLVVKGPVAALVVVGATVLIHNLEGYLLGPLVLGRAVRLHPIAVLLALAVGSILGGIVGAFVAVPALALAVTVTAALRSAPLVVGDAAELRSVSELERSARLSAGKDTRASGLD